MDNTTDKIVATGLGAGASALWWFQQNERDRADKMRNIQLDGRDTRDRLNDMLSSGDWYRLTTTAVRDVISGFSTANALRVAPTAIPNPVYQTRPDLTGGANIPGLSWPPTVSTYTENGNPQSFGELAQAAQVFTYEENRAWSQGMTLPKPPSQDMKSQIFFAAQGLSNTLAGMKMTMAQYQAAWLAVFLQAHGQSAGDPHFDPNKSPMAGAFGAGIASVVALTAQNVPGFPYMNPNTDAAMRFRVTTNAAVGSGNPIFTVTFATSYQWVRPMDGVTLPFQPVVHANGPLFYIEGISHNGFVVKNQNSLAANQVYDVFISVNAGV